MQIAIVDGESVLQVGDHRQVFPNTSFTYDDPDVDFLAENNAKKVQTEIRFDPDKQKIVPCQPFVDGDWVIVSKVASLTKKELEARATQKAEQHRIERNRLLANSDWTQLPDAPVDSAICAAYRQQLRDITNQPDFPWSVTWPVSPID